MSAAKKLTSLSHQKESKRSLANLTSDNFRACDHDDTAEKGKRFYKRVSRYLNTNSTIFSLFFLFPSLLLYTSMYTTPVCMQGFGSFRLWRDPLGLPQPCRLLSIPPSIDTSGTACALNTSYPCSVLSLNL